MGFVDGISVHKTIGDSVGTAVRSNEGSLVDAWVGIREGSKELVGITVISVVGKCDGSLEGVTVVGLTVEGLAVGLVDGWTLQSLEGLMVGGIDGLYLGVGLLVGL